MYMCIYIHNIYIYINLSLSLYIYIYIYIINGGAALGINGGGRITVGFHDSNLQIFNLRVSNPNELIVDVFLTRYRISTCQGLGPKNTMKFRKSMLAKKKC